MNNSIIYKPSSFDELVKKTEDDLIKCGFPITSIIEGSIFGSMVMGFLKTIYEFYEHLDNYVIPNMNLLTASSEWLDIKGAEAGIIRQVDTCCEGILIVFKVNSNTQLYIAKGTYIKPVNKDINYIVTEPFCINIYEMVGKLKVRAEKPGVSGNLKGGINFEFLEEVANVSEIVSQSDWITSYGTNYESDEKYRNRIVDHWKTIGTVPTVNMYKSLVLDHPDIKFVDVDCNMPRGMGSIDIYVSGEDGSDDNDIVENVQNLVDKYKGNYDNIMVFPMVVVRPDVTIHIYHTDLFSNNGSITTSIINNIKELEGNNYLFKSQIVSKVMKASEYIKRVEVDTPDNLNYGDGFRIMIGEFSMYSHKIEVD